MLIPKLNWVLRGFYGHFYQPPPLTSISGPILQYANDNNTGFIPLRGERDEEHQFGLQIPWRGWLLDADTFETRANNFLDHSNIGESSIFVPVTVQGALIQGLGGYPALTTPVALRPVSSGLLESISPAKRAHHRRPDLLSTIRRLRCRARIFGAGSRPAEHPESGHERKSSLSDVRSFNIYYGSGFSNGYTDPPPLQRRLFARPRVRTWQWVRRSVKIGLSPSMQRTFPIRAAIG